VWSQREGGDCSSPEKPATSELGLVSAKAARCSWSSSGGLGGGGGVGGGRTLAVDGEVLVGQGKWRMVPTASVSWWLCVGLRLAQLGGDPHAL
jgi:hypothetical protein